MPCIPFAGGFICVSDRGGRARRPRKCWVAHCHAGAPIECDWPEQGGKTCDRPVCRRHADEVGPDKHYCPPHSIENAKTKLRTGN